MKYPLPRRRPRRGIRIAYAIIHIITYACEAGAQTDAGLPATENAPDLGLPVTPSAVGSEADSSTEQRPSGTAEADAGASAEPDAGAPGVSHETAEVVAPAPPEPPVPPVNPAAPRALDVDVKSRSRGEQLERSAQPVAVVDLTEARRSSADLGEVLARVAGVSVRRTGALGSDQRFSLAGLTDQQVRFFLDGLPLELSGYPFGISNVPVNAIGRIEIYSGVVPIRFGADALGGAVQLVSDTPKSGYHGSASYQTGSFDTQRVTLNASRVDPKNGLFASAAGFGDHAKNDYPVTVEVPNAQGQSTQRRAYRFHDAYRASGANLTLGVINRPWAQRLLLRSFVTEYKRALQNDPFMKEPYGDASQREQSAGSTLSYRHTLSERVKLDLVGGYTFGRRRQIDVGTCIYDWFDTCKAKRVEPGELDDDPHDSLFRTHTSFARLNGTWQLSDAHALSLSIAPTFGDREGDERKQLNPDAPDLLNSKRHLLTFVAGLEHKGELLQKRVETLVFAKEYTQIVRSDEILRNGDALARNRDTYRLGAGASARYAFVDELWLKTSYEYATRLPSMDEIFGTNSQTDPNLQLKPELSHNGNLSLTTRLGDAKHGRYMLDVTGFLRKAEQLINLVGTNLVLSYANISSARSLGVQTTGSASTPGEYLTIDANATYQDFRNTSREGPFAAFYGDRITNRPYMFATASARLAFRDVMAERDRVSVSWVSRYTHQFYRSWESVGRRDSKAEIDAQLVHSIVATYLIESARAAKLSMSLDIQNITDAAVFDFYGVQKPGRAFYFKTTAEL